MVCTNVLGRKCKIILTVHTIGLVWLLLSFSTSSRTIPNAFLLCVQSHPPSSSCLALLYSLLPQFLCTYSSHGMKCSSPLSHHSPHLLLLVLQISVQVPLPQERQMNHTLQPHIHTTQSRKSSLLHSLIKLTSTCNYY